MGTANTSYTLYYLAEWEIFLDGWQIFCWRMASYSNSLPPARNAANTHNRYSPSQLTNVYYSMVFKTVCK